MSHAAFAVTAQFSCNATWTRRKLSPWRPRRAGHSVSGNPPEFSLPRRRWAVMTICGQPRKQKPPTRGRGLARILGSKRTILLPFLLAFLAALFLCVQPVVALFLRSHRGGSFLLFPLRRLLRKGRHTQGAGNSESGQQSDDSLHNGRNLLWVFPRNPLSMRAAKTTPATARAGTFSLPRD
jgi:hypothetical protein